MAVEWSPRVLSSVHLTRLVQELRSRGFRVLAPAVRDGAVTLDEVVSLEGLPRGWTAEMGPARYRLREDGSGRAFAWGAALDAPKRFLHPPELLLLAAERRDGSFSLLPRNGGAAPLALLGVKACDLRSVELLDKVLLAGPHRERGYAERRAATVLIGVDCTEPGGTCFCASMDAGPRCAGPFDVALTELAKEGEPVYVARAGTERGEDLLRALDAPEATPAVVAEARSAVDAARSRMGRVVDSDGLARLLAENIEHPRYAETAQRCLSCGSCTAVCPTCFCTSVADTTDLSGRRAERWRLQDSCQTLGFAYIHGGSVRATARGRFRQFLLHKLSYSEEQLGAPACVGCGRCVAWCPAGIDITEEAAAIRATAAPQGEEA